MRSWGERSASSLTSDDAGKEVDSVSKPGEEREEGQEMGEGQKGSGEGKEKVLARCLISLWKQHRPGSLETWVPVLTFLLDLCSFVNCSPILGLGQARVSLKPVFGLKLPYLFL